MTRWRRRSSAARSIEWRACSRRPSWRGRKEESWTARSIRKAIASLLLAALIGITVLAKVDSSAARTKRIALAFAALL